MLLYHLATKTKPQINDQLSLITKYIASKKLDSTLRVDKAIEYALSHIDSVKLDEFEKACGVGIVITPEQVEKSVEKYVKVVKDEILAKRYRYNSGLIMQNVRNELVWADGKAIKAEVELQVSKLFSFCMISLHIFIKSCVIWKGKINNLPINFFFKSISINCYRGKKFSKRQNCFFYIYTGCLH